MKSDEGRCISCQHYEPVHSDCDMFTHSGGSDTHDRVTSDYAKVEEWFGCIHWHRRA